MPRVHRPETHRSNRAAWLRAAVLGADDGIVSTASLMLGVAASSAGSTAVLTAGVAGLVAGAMSMAAGEYVSVSSQRDLEVADLEKERVEIEETPDAELRELTEIYVRRGLDHDLAHEVAVSLSEHDALGAHLRDELNLSPDDMADPVQAATTSAASFAVGAAIPLLAALVAPGHGRMLVIGLAALLSLGLLGALGARLGGAITGRASLRVLVGGGLAMAVTTVIGHFVGGIG